MHSCDSKSLTELPRPVCQVLAELLSLAALGHQFHSNDRFDSANKDSLPLSGRTGNDIETRIHSIDQVNVANTAPMKHGSRSAGQAAKAMRAVVSYAVTGTTVSFCFDNSSGTKAFRSLMNKILSQKPLGNGYGIG